MYDRPTLAELLDAVRMHLETHVIPAIKQDAKLYFQTLVAVNVLKIVEREYALRGEHQRAEWARLNRLEKCDTPYPADPAEAEQRLIERNRALCAAIRQGAYDAPEQEQALLAHLMALARESMEVANPKLLQLLDEEGRS